VDKPRGQVSSLRPSPPRGDWPGDLIIYVASDLDALAWVSVALPVAVALLRFTMLAIWLQQRQQPARAPAAAAAPSAAQPAEQRFPVPVVVLHGVAVTLVLVVLTAPGVGGVVSGVAGRVACGR
jgi:hypothetical protein